jgi:prevent-host-death family protein
MNVADAKANLSKLLAAAENGDEVLISRSGKPVVRLVPVDTPGQRVLGRWPAAMSPSALARSVAPLDAQELANWGIE